jgi:hypothetical protein
MRCSRLIHRIAAATSTILLMLWTGIAIAAEDTQSKTVGEITAYIGVVPAELVKGLGPHSAAKPMHGRTPEGQHELHVVVALFDTSTGARISDATVTAKVSGLGLSGARKTLEAMKIADTITYGAFFTLSRDLYTIRLAVQRPGARPAVFDFKHDHRR